MGLLQASLPCGRAETRAEVGPSISGVPDSVSAQLQHTQSQFSQMYPMSFLAGETVESIHAALVALKAYGYSAQPRRSLPGKSVGQCLLHTKDALHRFSIMQKSCGQL